MLSLITKTKLIYFLFLHRFCVFLRVSFLSQNACTAAVAACVGFAGWALAAIGGSALFDELLFIN